MTMLTHPGGAFRRAAYSPERRETVGAGTARAHLAMIKRFCVGVLTILVAGSALTAIMALKIAAYFWRLHY